MQAILKNGDRHNLDPRIDTLTIEPDERRFTLVWRVHITIRQSLHEMDLLIERHRTPKHGRSDFFET
jgi:hypothetical protein